MSILNQFSYPIMIIFLLIALYFILMRMRHVRWQLVVAVEALVIVVAVAAFITLRPGESDIDSPEQATALIGSGQPTLLEFFSNYCSGCIAVKPAFEQLASELDDEFNIVRVDIHSSAGRELRRQFGFSFTPEFILFDAEGEQVWRDNLLPSDEVLAMVRD